MEDVEGDDDAPPETPKRPTRPTSPASDTSTSSSLSELEESDDEEASPSTTRMQEDHPSLQGLGSPTPPSLPSSLPPTPSVHGLKSADRASAGRGSPPHTRSSLPPTQSVQGLKSADRASAGRGSPQWSRSPDPENRPDPPRRNPARPRKPVTIVEETEEESSGEELLEEAMPELERGLRATHIAGKSKAQKVTTKEKTADKAPHVKRVLVGTLTSTIDQTPRILSDPASPVSVRILSNALLLF